MRPSRRVLTLATTLMVAALTFGACAPAASNAPASAPASSPSGSAGAESSAPPAAKTVVIFWQEQFEDYQQAWFKKQIAAFNASQDAIEVQHVVVPRDAWAEKLKAAQAAGKAPDVVTSSYGQIDPGVVNGQFARLDDLISKENFDKIEPAFKPFVSTDAGYFAYPMLVEPAVVLYYRKDLFTAAGLDPAKPPTSWDELLTYARALTKDGVFGMGIAQDATSLAWSSWGLQWNAAGQLPISDDWSTAEATKPGFKKLAEFYKTLYTEKLMPPEAVVPYQDILPYGEGKVAMSAGGSWAIGQLTADFPETLANTAVAAFPSIDGDPTKPTSTLGGWTLTVDAKSKVQQQAADYISWLLAGDPAIMMDFFKTAGHSKYSPLITVAEALAADPEASGNPFLAVVTKDVLPYAKPEPAYPFDLSLAFGTAIEKAMKGGDVDAALAEANVAIQDIIEKQKLAGTAP